MNTESQYEKMYNDLVAGLEKMHRRNVKRTSSALKSLLIIPTFFLIMLFMTQGSKTIFLVLWIASMFVIAGILIVIEYQDYLLRQMFTQVDVDEPQYEQAEDPLPDEAASKDEALVLAERIRQSIQQRDPEYEAQSDDAETIPEAETVCEYESEAACGTDEESAADLTSESEPEASPDAEEVTESEPAEADKEKATV